MHPCGPHSSQRGSYVAFVRCYGFLAGYAAHSAPPEHLAPQCGSASLHLQGGWERHQSLAPVLIQGSWALLTCKCRSLGPSGGSDRLCLVKLPTSPSEQVRAFHDQINAGRLCLVKLSAGSSKQVRALRQQRMHRPWAATLSSGLQEACCVLALCLAMLLLGLQDLITEQLSSL